MPTEMHEAKRVLLVDDDRPILRALADGMRCAGYVVIEAESGDSALEIASANRFDVAILDVRMPGMSGLELAKTLSLRSDIPFLFMSAHSEADVVRDAADYGASGYLLKPVAVSQVIPAIETVLARAVELKKLRETEANLNVALASGREINIAIGIIMERNRVDRQGAFDILRISARSQRRKMNDLAEEFVKAAEIMNFMR